MLVFDKKKLCKETFTMEDMHAIALNLDNFTLALLWFVVSYSLYQFDMDHNIQRTLIL